MKYAAYTDYRETPLEWAGPIPGHWQIKKIGHLALLKSGENIVSEEIAEGGEYPVFGGNGFRGYFNQYTHDGDFVLIGRQGALCGNINYASGKFWASEHALVAHSLTEFDIHWFGETLRAMNLNQYSVSAAQPGLAASAISALRVPFPPVDEQQTIARFLDAKTVQIDALVAQKQQLIAKLKEKRSALIARTVTRGLPPEAAKAAGLEPNPEMKDSGVDWLGAIPCHWQVKRLRYLGNAIIGLTYDPGDVSDPEDGTLVLRSSNVQDGRISFDDNVFVRGAIPSKLRTRLGDILICSRNGSRALIGKNARIDETSAGITFGAFMTIFRSRFSEFLYWAFNSEMFTFQSGAFLTSTINQLTVNNLNSFSVALPPKEEQRHIALFLEKETAQLNRLISSVEAAIARLTEYRQALITSAVTGKIDVRNWQSELEAA